MSKHIQTGQQRGGSPIVFKSGKPISVICVASTFTSLSYADNGGKVQITSADVHGLTTSPAVGANVYVSWAGGTGVSGLYTVLSVDSTTAITIDLVHVAMLGTPSIAIAGTAITVIENITIPTLSVNSRIEVSAGTTITASAATKEIKFLLSGTYFAARNTSTPTHKLITMLGFLQNRGSQNTQVCSLYNAKESSTPTTYTERNINTSIPSALTITLSTTLANERVRLEQYLIEVFI